MGQRSIFTRLGRGAAGNGPQTLTANLKPLQRRGLVETAIDPSDRRGRRLTLTEAGRTLLRSAGPIWERTHDEAEQVLGTDLDSLRASLRALS